MDEADRVSVKLPVIYCGCGSQLTTHICVTSEGELICIFCARDQAKSGATITPVYPPTGWGGMGLAPALDPFDGIALLARHGATILTEE
jgi:hypothetical protein